MEVNIETYRLFNDVRGFHDLNKPWKTVSPALYTAFKDNYKKNEV